MNGPQQVALAYLCRFPEETAHPRFGFLAARDVSGRLTIDAGYA